MKRNLKRCCGGTKNKESMVLQIVRKKIDQVVIQVLRLKKQQSIQDQYYQKE